MVSIIPCLVHPRVPIWRMIFWGRFCRSAAPSAAALATCAARKAPIAAPIARPCPSAPTCRPACKLAQRGSVARSALQSELSGPRKSRELLQRVLLTYRTCPRKSSAKWVHEDGPSKELSIPFRKHKKAEHYTAFQTRPLEVQQRS